jgi:peptide/nickel transport system ATP-binding protein
MEPNRRTLLQVNDLSVVFDTRRGPAAAVLDVSFGVAAGEVLAIVGESGAGKSVTGMAILGLLEPPARIVAGEVSFDGEPLGRLAPRSMRPLRGRKIGAVFQDPLSSLDPLFTIGDQLIETIMTHAAISPTEARAKAVRLLDEVGIASARLDQYPHELSGGMRQRVVIALALCGDPMLLVADEPTTALDASTQAQILELLDRLRREREMAVMLITHDMSVVAAIADRVTVMYAGRIVETGRTETVVGNPRHPYTRGLMLAIPRLGARPPRLVQIDGVMPPAKPEQTDCAFHPRCRERIDVCSQAAPPLRTFGATRFACWHAAGVRNAHVGCAQIGSAHVG